MRRKLITHALLGLILVLTTAPCLLLANGSTIYYVATDGTDSNQGSLEKPFRTLERATQLLKPGEKVLVRGGTYQCDKTIVLDKSGEEAKPIHVWAYKSEIPVFDFSKAFGNGLQITSAHWHVRGLTIQNAEVAGILLQYENAHHCVVEQCTARSNGETGILIMEYAAHNLIINCDSLHNFRPSTDGNSGDGFGAYFGVANTSLVKICRFRVNGLARFVILLPKKNIPGDAFCVLAITMEDLYPEPSWNFVFGQASLRERIGIYSFARYDPAFYGQKRGKDYEQLLLRRSCKVLAHETGHMFGLQHCTYFKCILCGSNHLKESDSRPVHLCPVCLRKLQYSIRFDVVGRYRNLLRFYRKVGFDNEARWVANRLRWILGVEAARAIIEEKNTR